MVKGVRRIYKLCQLVFWICVLSYQYRCAPFLLFTSFGHTPLCMCHIPSPAPGIPPPPEGQTSAMAAFGFVLPLALYIFVTALSCATSPPFHFFSSAPLSAYLSVSRPQFSAPLYTPAAPFMVLLSSTVATALFLGAALSLVPLEHQHYPSGPVRIPYC